MKRVISTKVDKTKYAEFLEYCAKAGKYPANALRDALDILLNHDKTGVEEKPKELSEPTQEPVEVQAWKPESVKGRGEKKESKTDADEEELEL